MEDATKRYLQTDIRALVAENEAGRIPTRGALRVLVVEDEYYIADDLRRALEEGGAHVIGPAPTVEQALAIIADGEDISVAVLDVKLGDEAVWPVVDALKRRGVDYVFATGYSDAEIPAVHQSSPLFRKPTETPALVRKLLERQKLGWG